VSQEHEQCGTVLGRNVGEAIMKRRELVSSASRKDVFSPGISWVRLATRR